jgi:hypothetical protein
MKVHLIVILLAVSLVPAFAQILPPGRYAQLFLGRNYELVLNVTTNGPIDLAWLHVNQITGQIASHGTFYGQATNKPNGVITGRFRGHGFLRGRVRDGGTNGLTGTLWFRIDGHRGYARRFQLQPDY